MSISHDNVLMRFQHGRIGNVIMRVLYGKSVASQIPDYSKIVWSRFQKANRKHFGKGMRWAQALLKDPEWKTYYQHLAGGRMSAYNAAVKDYLTNPRICEVITSEYNGRKGDTIRVDANKYSDIKGVMVTIVNAQGFEIETNLTVNVNPGIWIFEAREDNPFWQNGGIVVEVTDFPGNSVKKYYAFKT